MSQMVHASYLNPCNQGILLPQRAVVIGGTPLLEEFLQLAAQHGSGDLSLCAPFIDRKFLDASSAWELMNHSGINLRIVTGHRMDATNAWSALRVFPWQSAEVWQCRNLHAKVYSFIFRESGLALVGSHNLTRRGLSANIEAGVLLQALGPGSELLSSVFACQEHVNSLKKHCKILIDTKRWPQPDELHVEEITHV